MANIHPLKRRSVKPSISTIRGMLPGAQFRALDAAMQSLRSAGILLNWVWKSKEVGWLCEGNFDGRLRCELLPTFEPLLGHVLVEVDLKKKAFDSVVFPKNFKPILDVPVRKEKSVWVFEFSLETTEKRNLFTTFIEAFSDLL